MSIRIVLVGLGHIGRRHASIIQLLDDFELVATVDPVHSGLEGIPHFSSLENFFQEDLEAEVATIATPNHLHAPLAKLAIQKGLHAIIEKPLAIHETEAMELLDWKEKYHKEIFLVMQNRFNPIVLWLKEVIENQKLGKIFMVQVNCFWNRGDSYYQPNSWKGKKDQDGGVLLTQFSHYLDMMFWLMGSWEVTFIQEANVAHQTTTEFNDTGVVGLQFANGAMGSFSYTTASFQKNVESTLTILGEKGSIKLMGPYMDQLVFAHWEGNDAPPVCEVNPLVHPTQNVQDNHRLFYQHVAYSLQQNLSPTIELKDGVEIIKLANKMLKG
jgi:UDP-N-acetyl-2-amino-2-deoxyglucuronate dehydrogenase